MPGDFEYSNKYLAAITAAGGTPLKTPLDIKDCILQLGQILGTVTGAGVAQLVAGTNVTISPTGGTGIVTVNATGGGGSGTVTSTSVVSANGFAGTVATATTTPAITLTTSVTGVLKGNGTAISAAVAGTDYLAPNGNGSALTGITNSQVSGSAPIASPTFTGTATAPTASALTDNTQLATTAYTDSAVGVETTRAETAEALKLAIASNLSDVADAGSSRFNMSIPALSAVAAAATANVSLSAPGATLDGYTLLTNDEVLLTAQTTSSQNGVWTWSGASSALVRPNEFPSGGVVKRGRTVAVVNGTVNGKTEWILSSTAAGITIDTTAQVWTQAGTGTYVTAPTPGTKQTATKIFNVRDYGAPLDGVHLYDGVIASTSGNAVLTSATGIFTQADVGKSIGVLSAGTGNAMLLTTIASVQSAGQATLATPAINTVNGVGFTYGTGDTTAIQSAIQAAFNAGGGRVLLPKPLNGPYILNGNFTSIPNYPSDTGQYLLYWPYQASTGVQIPIEMVGESGLPLLPVGGSQQGPGGVVVLYNLSPQSPAPGSSLFPYVIGGGNVSSTANNISISMVNITIRQDPARTNSNTVHGVNLTSVQDYFLDNFMVDVDAIINSGSASSVPFPDPSTVSRSCTGIVTTGGVLATGANIFGPMGVGVIGYNEGAQFNDQATIFHLYTSWCKIAVQLNTGSHVVNIKYHNANNCPTIYKQNTTSYLAVDCMDAEGNPNSGLWCFPVAHLALNAVATGYIRARVQNTPSNFVITGASTHTGTMRVMPIDGTPLTVTLNGSAAPTAPVSATVYQNTTAAPLTIYIPCYATTGGTAGSVAVALGTSASPSTIFTEYVTGSTTSSLTDTIVLVVPPGQYFSVTQSGVTFGTTTYSQQVQ